MHSKQEYHDYLETAHWKLIAEQVKERAGHRCQVCNRDSELEAHHRTYRNLFHEAENLGDLTCLCRTCHGLFHRSKNPPRENPEKIRRERPRAGQFFRKAATKLSINQFKLSAFGEVEVKRMLVEHEQNRRSKRAERKARRAAHKARNLSLYGKVSASAVH